MKPLAGSVKLIFLVLVCLSLASPVWAQQVLSDEPSVYLDITPGEGRKYKIAITDLWPQSSSGDSERNAGYLPERLRANLSMTGLFEAIDKRAFLETDLQIGLEGTPEPDFSAWTRIGADYLVKGSLKQSGFKLSLNMRLFDVSLGRLILDKSYTGPAKEARQLINFFTNDLLEAITGTPGVFGSQIIFVSGTKSEKSIMMTALGGDEVEELAGHRNGPSTQPTLGPDGRTAWIHRNKKNWELLVNGKVIASGPLHLSPAFQPDGTVAAAVSEAQRTAIYAFNGKKKSLLAGGGGINISPTFSPDGSRMAYVSNQDGSVSLYICPAGGGAPTRLTSGAKATDPVWSPTGEFIAFVMRETDICIIRPDGTGFRQLTGGQGINERPSFSPDGRMIVFSSNRNGREQLFVMAANGDNPQPLLPEYSGHQNQPYWSPTMPEAYER